MNTVVLGILFFLFIYTTIISLYKAFGENAIYSFGSVAILLANIQVLKGVAIYGIIQYVPLGNILFASLLFCSRLIKNSFAFPAINIFIWISALGIMHITTLYESHAPCTIDNAICTLFHPGYYIALSSLCAYIISQTLYNVCVKKVYFINDTIASIICNIIDTCLFSYLFYVVFMENYNIQYIDLLKNYILAPLCIRSLCTITHTYLIKLVL